MIGQEQACPVNTKRVGSLRGQSVSCVVCEVSVLAAEWPTEAANRRSNDGRFERFALSRVRVFLHERLTTLSLFIC